MTVCTVIMLVKVYAGCLHTAALCFLGHLKIMGCAMPDNGEARGEDGMGE